MPYSLGRLLEHDPQSRRFPALLADQGDVTVPTGKS